MPAYLLTWNPDRFEWSDLNAEAAAVARGQSLTSRWSCGNTTSIPVGSRSFMYRQGSRGRGVVGSGWTTRATFQDPHWDPERAARGDTANYVGIALDALLDPDNTPPLAVERSRFGPLAKVNWSTPASGIRIPDDAAISLDELWFKYAGGLPGLHAAEDEEMRALEGEPRVAMVVHRSRERALRGAKIADARRSTGRLRCEVPGCGFDFEEKYGSVGAGYAHVHHVVPLAEGRGLRETRLSDLAIVCANCHAMIHKGGACRPLANLIPTRSNQGKKPSH